jgi:hypothetical protein
VKTTVVGVFACTFCSILPLLDVYVGASQNDFNVFMKATYKSEVAGAVKRSSGRVPSKYMKSLFLLLCEAMWCNGTLDFAVERFIECTSWHKL